MAYFPFFINLSGRKGLIVGGGEIALHKAKTLIPFGAEITLVAPEICPGLRQIGNIHFCERRFSDEDLDNVFFAVAATDNNDLNRHISHLCEEKRIAVNVVDNEPLCSFIFPSLVQRGDLTIGISTSGASPAAAVYLKERIASLIPERFDEILAFMRTQRENLKGIIPVRQRKIILNKLLIKAAERGRPLTEAETEEFYYAETDDAYRR